MIDYLEKIKNNLKIKNGLHTHVYFFSLLMDWEVLQHNTKKIYRSMQDLSIILRKKTCPMKF